MTNEEIRKLLGGYAANSLTEAERKTLFQAALEDQDLFNALQDEEALRDLLADPVSRAQVQRALEQPVRPKPAWWARRWTWAGASAIAAAVIIAGVVRTNTASKRLEQAQSLDAVSSPAPPSASIASAGKVPEPATPKPVTPKTVTPEPANPRGRVAAPAAAEDKDQKLTDSTARGNDDFRAGAREFDKEKKPGAVGGVAGGIPSSPPAAAPAPPPPQAEVAQQRAQAPSQPAQSQAARSQPSQSQAAPAQAAGQGGGGVSQNTAQNSNAATPNPQNQTINGSFGGLSNGRRDGPATVGALMPFAARTVTGNRAVNYVIVRRDASGNYLPVPPNDGLKAGDEVRLSVTPAVSGLLTLDQVDATGAPSRVFPAASAGLTVVSNTSYTIPASPITVKDTDQKYRIVLNVEAVQAETSTTAVKDSMRKATPAAVQSQLKQGTSLQPVEVIIGPKRAQ